MLQELKDILGILDNTEDARLQNIITKGKIVIDDMVGVTLDYDTLLTAKVLLLEYCRYDYNNASEYFEENFKGDILRLQLKTGISQLPGGVI